MGKRGAKPWEPSWEEFNKLCAIQATLEEIAAWYDVGEVDVDRAVRREFGQSLDEYLERKRKSGFISIRRVLFQKAQSGDKAALDLFISEHMSRPPQADGPLTFYKDAGKS